MNINGKVAGGASGLGLATVRKLHEVGATVVIVDLPSSDGIQVVDELGERTAGAVAGRLRQAAGRPGRRPAADRRVADLDRPVAPTLPTGVEDHRCARQQGRCGVRVSGEGLRASGGTRGDRPFDPGTRQAGVSNDVPLAAMSGWHRAMRIVEVAVRLVSAATGFALHESRW